MFLQLYLAEHPSSCNLRMWTINGKLIERTHVEVQVYCLCYTAAPEGVYVNVLVGGLANGGVRLVCVYICTHSVAFNDFCSETLRLLV